MKTLPTLAFIAALVASVVLPVNFEIAGSLLFGAGLAAIALNDYTRRYQPLALRLSSVAVTATQRTERFGLAA